MALERLRQVTANFPVLSVQPGGELQDQAVGPSPCLLTMPCRLPFLDESAPSILVDGFLRASDFLQVGTGKLLAELKGLSSTNKSIGGTLATTNRALVETFLYVETILSAIDLCVENSSLCIAWFCRAFAHTGAA